MFIQSNLSGEWERSSEVELWAEYCKGNREALSVLFLRSYERLFRYGMQFSSGEDAVMDAIQKLFFRLWKNRKALTCPRSVNGYLYVSLRRILLRKSKRNKARDRRHDEYMEYESTYINSIEDMIIGREEKEKRRELLRFALQELAPRQKEALLLRIDSGMSNREIADIMGVSDKRVRNLIYEATKRLKEEIYRLSD